MTIQLIMDDKSEDNEILRKLNDEIHNLNEKVADLSSKIERLSKQYLQQENRDVQKEVIKEKRERQSNYCYALGGLAVALASIMLGFTQIIDYFYTMTPKKFYFYLFGNSLILFSGISLIFSGYQIVKYSNRKGNIKKIRVGGHQTKVLVFWKRDIPLLISVIFVFVGMFFLFWVAMGNSFNI